LRKLLEKLGDMGGKNGGQLSKLPCDNLKKKKYNPVNGLTKTVSNDASTESGKRE